MTSIACASGAMSAIRKKMLESQTTLRMGENVIRIRIRYEGVGAENAMILLRISERRETKSWPPRIGRPAGSAVTSTICYLTMRAKEVCWVIAPEVADTITVDWPAGVGVGVMP